MSEKTKPKGFRIVVPKEYGDVYGEGDSREWIERRQRIGRPIILEFAGIKKFLTDKKAFEKGCKLLGRIFSDWNLTGDYGPLPKPWENAEAFKALIDSDQDLFLWVVSTSYKSIAELISAEETLKN